MASCRDPLTADHCCAKLIEMFGENQLETIYNVGTSCQWNCKFLTILKLNILHPLTYIHFFLVSQCVEALLKTTDQSTGSNNREPIASSSRINDTSPNDQQFTMSFSDRLQIGLGATSFSNQVQNNNDRSDKNSHLDKLYYQISDGYKILILLRGLPGSGKSTVAKKLIQRAGLDPSQHIISADNYFKDRFGNYNYDPSKISNAHQDCHMRAKQLMIRNVAPIFIDNTNVQLWQMEEYCLNAVDHGYIVQILEPTTWWSKNPEECARRNTHGVPLDRIMNMKRTYERIQNGQELLDHFHLPKRIQYQLREYPPIVKSPDPEPEPKEESDVIKSFSPIQSTDDVVIDSEELVKTNPFVNYNWMAHEKEVNSYWQENILPKPSELGLGDVVGPASSTKNNAKESESHSKPKPLRERAQKKDTDSNRCLHEQMLNALKDDTDSGKEQENSRLEELQPIQQHRKGCRNENEAFADIRLLFPAVSIKYLWDMFEKCNGDANWMMNILLNENVDTDDIPGDCDEDFYCSCDSPAWTETATTSDGTPQQDDGGRSTPMDARSEASSTSNTGKGAPLPQRQKKKGLNHPTFQMEAEEMKRQIEESVRIGDEFYTENMKKVREWKSKKRPDTRSEQQSQQQFQEISDQSSYATGAEVGEEDGEEDDYEMASDDDIYEFNLGSEFVNQLEGMFNTNPNGLDFHKFRPNVYMSKSLAKQIYHLWVESMMFQLEEQRLEALKDDEEIAREISSQFEEKRNAVNFSDVAQMACAMNAYRSSDNNEWIRDSTDLAVKLKQQKLYEIFPNIDKETIDEILHQNNDNYDRVVDTLTNSYKDNAEARLVEQQNKLMLAAKYESQNVSRI